MSPIETLGSQYLDIVWLVRAVLAYVKPPFIKPDKPIVQTTQRYEQIRGKHGLRGNLIM